MTNPVIRIEPAKLRILPGGQARAVVTIANPGTIVEGFRLDVLGDGPPAWATLTPPEVSIYPQQETTATLVFSLPAQGVASGNVAFGLRAVSVVDRTSSAVAEGDLEIADVLALRPVLTPVTSAGWLGGRHTLSVSNDGNRPARLRVTAADPDQRLAIQITPEIFDVPASGTTTTHLTVRTKKWSLFVSPVRLPFQVTGEPYAPGPTPTAPAPVAPGGAGRFVADAGFTQRPIVPRSVQVVLFALLAGLVALVVSKL